jgi:phosphopantothenoylcysteine synthetase/decarboxylase
MKNPVVILGVTGSIAAFKAAEIASQLVKEGADVHVVMTPHACDFITPLTMQTLSRNPVVTASWNAQTTWKPGHIELADRADVLLVAPATANVIAELAHGLASHPLAEIALATRAPLLIAPAMNGKMWDHPATQANVELLESRGAEIVGPDEGLLACGYEGQGRLATVQQIVARTLAKLRPARKLAPKARPRSQAA